MLQPTTASPHLTANILNRVVNHLNGEDALSYSRERKSLPNGDFSRGEHQQQVLMAMIQKAMSPAILTGYSSIMSSLEDSFVTSMSSGDITSLVRFVLSEGSNGLEFCKL